MERVVLYGFAGAPAGGQDRGAETGVGEAFCRVDEGVAGELEGDVVGLDLG